MEPTGTPLPRLPDGRSRERGGQRRRVAGQLLLPLLLQLLIQHRLLLQVLPDGRRLRGRVVML